MLAKLIELFELERPSLSDLDDNELIMSVADMMDWSEEQVFNEACKQTNTTHDYNDYFKTVMSNKPSLPNSIRHELRKAFKDLT